MRIFNIIRTTNKDAIWGRQTPQKCQKMAVFPKLHSFIDKTWCKGILKIASLRRNSFSCKMRKLQSARQRGLGQDTNRRGVSRRLEKSRIHIAIIIEIHDKWPLGIKTTLRDSSYATIHSALARHKWLAQLVNGFLRLGGYENGSQVINSTRFG